MLVDQGKDDEAEPLHRRALSMREELHGTKHPEVATSLEFLVRMAIKQGTSLVHTLCVWLTLLEVMRYIMDFGGWFGARTSMLSVCVAEKLQFFPDRNSTAPPRDSDNLQALALFKL